MDFWRASLKVLVVLILFHVGMVNYPVAMLGPDRSLIPGDLIEARSNNYVLEHFHSFITGRQDRYWDAPLIYPAQNALAHSENLLGSAPIYSVFRSIGLTRESAFQAWIVTVFALNFWCCFIAMRIWTGKTLASAAGAYIFAFGISTLDHLSSIELLPRFASPFALVFTWSYLRTTKVRFLIWAIAALVLQLYCGLQIGIQLLVCLFFLGIAHSIVFRRGTEWDIDRKLIAPIALTIILIVAMIPLMIPYLSASFDVIRKDPGPAVQVSALFNSYFTSHPAATSWQDLALDGSLHIRATTGKFFPGGICIGSLLIALILMLIRRDRMQRNIAIPLIALFLSTAFQFLYLCIDWPGTVPRMTGAFSGAIHALPNIQILFFILDFVILISILPDRKWITLIMVPLVPITILIDNKIDADRIPTFNKWHARNLVAEVERDITATDPKDFSAIAYMPLMPVIEDELIHDRVTETNITAMLAAQQLDLPIVNGYTGSYPEGYMDLCDRMDDRSLGKWCEHAGCDPASIARVTNVPVAVLDRDTVTLQAANGKFICANLKREGLMVADRTDPQLWETYLMIRTTEDRVALLAHNGNFVCAELLQQQQLSATAPELGDFGLFRIVPLEDGWIALRAFNDRFLSVNDEGLIYASAEAIGQKERFRINKITPEHD